MAPIILKEKDYTWTETDGTLVVNVTFPSLSAQKLDIFSTDVYVKVNCAPYLFFVDLFDEVDEQKSVATVERNVVIFKMVKKENRMWGRLTFEGDKAVVEARRDASVEDFSKRQEELKKARMYKKDEQNRFAFNTQWDYEKAERKRMEDRKAKEKSDAEKEVYDWAGKSTAEKNKEIEALQALSTEDRDEQLEADAVEAAVTAAMQEKAGITDSGRRPASAPAAAPAAAKSAAPVASKEEPPKASKPKKTAPAKPAEPIPAPRDYGVTKIKFTVPDAKPGSSTKAPARNADLREDIELAEKQKGLEPAENDEMDSMNIGERNTAFLKDKGDKMYRAGDFKGAVSAYTTAINVNKKSALVYMNRAACYLHMRDFDKTIEDCTAALSLLVPRTSDKARMSKVRAFARRGAAYCWSGKANLAHKDYEMALKLDPANEQIRRDLYNIAKCLGQGADPDSLKKRGDDFFKKGEYVDALKAYDTAISMDSNHIGLWTNRATVNIAIKNFHGAVNDCTQAIRVLASAGPFQFQQNDYQKKMFRLLVKRGAAYSSVREYGKSHADYLQALRIDPDNEQVKADIEKIAKAMDNPREYGMVFQTQRDKEREAAGETAPAPVPVLPPTSHEHQHGDGCCKPSTAAS